MKDFKEVSAERVVIADGAMGTEIYRRGVFINVNFDRLNLTDPHLVRRIHEEYVSAGAEVLETNTFGANRVKLAKYGFEKDVREINIRGVRLAREVAAERAWVGGAVGPLGRPLKPVGVIDESEAREAFREQLEALFEGGVDLIIFETFEDLRELKIAVEEARRISSDIPVVVMFSFRYYGEGRFEGSTPEEAVRTMSKWDVDLIGTNCGNGPRGILDIVERMAPLAEKPLAAMPNAGLPEMIDGRLIYMTTPEYFAEYGRRMVLKGVSLVGGCCGTTPEHIKELRKFIRSVSPARSVVVEKPGDMRMESLPPVPLEKRSRFGSRLGREFIISVEIDPPRGIDPSPSLEGARFLAREGIHAVNIADGPRAMARMSPVALGVLIRDNVPELDIILHYTCRDRNLLGMQMDLIGANALNLNNILAVTGDPPKMGDYPDATAVFDTDSIGLIRFIQMLNRGLDLAGRPLGQQTALVVGAGCNPGSVNLDVEVERFGRKIEAGAEFFFSQPVYDPELLYRFFELTASFPEVPFFVGILPLSSYRMAEFFHNEVPGMQVPEDVLERMKKAGSESAQREEGTRIAAEALREAKKHPRVKGAYIFPPGGRYERVFDVLEKV